MIAKIIDRLKRNVDNVSIVDDGPNANKMIIEFLDGSTAIVQPAMTAQRVYSFKSLKDSDAEELVRLFKNANYYYHKIWKDFKPLIKSEELAENKKVVKVTKNQLQKIINEGVRKLHKKTLIENRIREINEELDSISGFNGVESIQQKEMNITIQVRGGWQEVITILPEDEYYYQVYHQFDNGKLSRVNGGFHNFEDAEEWVNNSYLPNYNTHEIIDVEIKEPSELKESFDQYGNPYGFEDDFSEESIKKFDSERGIQEYVCWNSGSGVYDIAKYDSNISWHDDEDVFKGTREECEQHKQEMEDSNFEKNNFDDDYWNQKNLYENDEVASPTIMNILDSYLEAALWTDEDELGQANLSDISNNSKIDSYKDVKKFLEQAGELIDGIDPEQIGHDLWLTRNGHGAGFWDRGLGEVGEQLANIARGMGSKYIGWNDDGEIHID